MFVTSFVTHFVVLDPLVDPFGGNFARDSGPRQIDS